MQVPNSEEIATKSAENPAEPEELKPSKPVLADGEDSNGEDDSILDVSGKSLDFSLLENSEGAVKGLYIYKNVFNLIPKSLGDIGRLRVLKFFGNEINLFPSELRNLVGLECLQVRISSTGFGQLPLNKLSGLKELELSKVPPRPSALPILGEISGLKCLTKLSVCHFSLRYLPPEIGCLSNLEHLDVSFNKLKRLPTEISYLSALISLKVANNKLVELPSALSSLQRLENMDLSHNRLTSLGSLELGSMHNLQVLNLQYNRLLSKCQIPSWLHCNLEGNGEGITIEDCSSSSVEMDVYESPIQVNDGSLSRSGNHHSSSNLLTGSSTNSRCFASRRSGKRWKRQYYLQQKARQERLNNSRKWKGVDPPVVTTIKADVNWQPESIDTITSYTCEVVSEAVSLDDDKEIYPGEAESVNLPNGLENDNFGFKKGPFVENGSSVEPASTAMTKTSEVECCEPDDESLSSKRNGADDKDVGFIPELSQSSAKSKRASEGDLGNPKPCKSRKPAEDSTNISCKYSNSSYCSTEDHLPDGFYDAGRDRPFMPLSNYEENLHLDSREVIVVDREQDEVLDAITLSAQALVLHLKQINRLNLDRNQVVDNLQIASLLALFVSDHFGGSDRSAMIEGMRKTVSGSNYQKPFVCTCSTGNRDSMNTFNKPVMDSDEVMGLTNLCERSLQSIKARRNSIVVPIGALQFGVCRHRALLLKYLCDRMEPPVPCELVRGYLDFLPHAWNAVLVKRGGSYVRMMVDACRPNDIREETDPEYFCRYVPLSRSRVPVSTERMPVPGGSFPSLSTCDGIDKSPSSSLVRCNLGTLEAAAKVRSMEICETSVEAIRKFEYNCLGEVRILGALKHPCIVKMYGHQISTKWIPSVDGKLERRVLQSAIFVEYIKGGSLKSYIDKLSEANEKHVPVELALYIARDVTCALAELHSKHIIHRDIKSENILIDLDEKGADGSPVVKLCDFDKAVPLRSSVHTCCIAHYGIESPDCCVGTPRWMAPEVLRAMHKRNTYGLEVDIWSFGCLLLELLTLQIPYLDLSEEEIYNQLKRGQRPQVRDELESLGSSNESSMAQSVTEPEGSEDELETLGFLIDLFRQCTMEDPRDRPTAAKLHEVLLSRTTKFRNSSSLLED